MPQINPVRRWLLPAALSILLLAGLLGGRMLYELAQPVNAVEAAAVTITVKPGMSTQEIGQVLYEKNLIKSVSLFQLVARIEGLEKSLQAAEYSFSTAMSVRHIVGMLAKGEVAYRQFTVPEGYTIDQIALLLAEKNLADPERFKAAAKSLKPFDYIEDGTGVVYPTEGFAFPDTYRVARVVTEPQLLQMMLYQFNERFTPPMRERARQMGLSLREVVILASLVEKEAQLEADRPIIAAVFMNRLKLEMPLQSCATIQYILGYPKPELTIQDTQLPSPYNTYLHMGLPPGPIANPGVEAIKAVLYPATTDYLYFVADKNGVHHFSTTYEQHLNMIAQVSQ
ncbi:MAG: endolytic transglycosylase MltG [Sporomusaceae bacterium]|nr:endolytic transglycosylase MltG [Sporomusaceae bacterium]